jgi:hypothetical protein
MSQNDVKTIRDPRTDDDGEEMYERPEIIDYGTLTELTLSGNGGPMSDSLLSSAS